MEWSIKCAYIPVLYGALATVIVALLYRWKVVKRPLYIYPFTQVFINEGLTVSFPYRTIINAMRIGALLILAFLIARPQLVDTSSQVHVEGIDIMLVLDVSGSMQLFDSLKDSRRRIDVAKQEAINFIKKRHDDPIGLVLFGNEALSRCPLTLDKKMLESIVKDVDLGIINPDGTMLIRGIVMALNRMRKSEAKSRILIVLTDGEPTPGDLDPQAALELAKKIGVKMYTIGIGAEEGGYYEHPFFGLQQARAPLNKNLLYNLAYASGGQFFQAKDPTELAKIYNTIDQLEKTEYETNIYHKYYDIFMHILPFLIMLIAAEIFLSRFLWVGLGV